jgi:uncharacterized membrane protein YcfT
MCELRDSLSDLLQKHHAIYEEISDSLFALQVLFCSFLMLFSVFLVLHLAVFKTYCVSNCFRRWTSLFRKTRACMWHERAGSVWCSSGMLGLAELSFPARLAVLD